MLTGLRVLAAAVGSAHARAEVTRVTWLLGGFGVAMINGFG
jgi:hypothetical protein